MSTLQVITSALQLITSACDRYILAAKRRHVKARHGSAGKKRNNRVPSGRHVIETGESVDKKEEVWEFEKLEQQLHSFLDEMSALSSKKPDGPVNKFKLNFLNATLKSINKIIDDYRPFPDFEQFDVDSLPSNSDV